MPMPQEYRDALIEKHTRAEREARRDTRREMLRVMVLILFWVLCGLFLIGMALHVTDHTIGMAFWWGGHVVWIAGVAGAIHSAYRRGEARGDW
jgi:hypothetical protein